MIDFYTWSTPNGRKVAIALEELGLRYRVRPVNIRKGEQFRPEFLRISPNGKIPAIMDPEGPASDGGPGPPITLFESGAILIYLAERARRLLPTEPRARLDVLQWLMWQMGGFGPMLGQAHHFVRFTSTPHPYAEERYRTEAQRLYGVLDRRLDGRSFVAGDYSIADVALYPWADRHAWQGVSLEDFPNVRAWHARLGAREAVRRGMNAFIAPPRPAAR